MDKYGMKDSSKDIKITAIIVDKSGFTNQKVLIRKTTAKQIMNNFILRDLVSI